MKICIEVMLLLLGIIMISIGIQYKHKSKQSSCKEEIIAWKTKAILLFIYGCLYEVFIIIVFRYYDGNNNPYLPYFLITFLLGKVSYNLLYWYFNKKEYK